MLKQKVNVLQEQLVPEIITPEQVKISEEIHNPTVEFDVIVKKMRVSAYCPCRLCCGNYSDGVTSTGKSAYTKGVAVDPTVIPYGTIINIPGYGEVIADDCGGAIKGNRLDVRFTSHQAALNWGVKNLEVRIYIQPKAVWEDKGL